jgi:D-arabinose 1-dehydrogenase-like Zn-dependent alcohol dehydrogenase
MNDTMTATLIREHGGPERLLLETVERPRPGPGEAVVRVAACALNHLDIFVRRGTPGIAVRLPHTAGGASWGARASCMSGSISSVALAPEALRSGVRISTP